MSRRVQKVAALLKREVSELINETVPREMGIVTLTDVDLTSDLKDAKIYISILDRSKSEIIFTLLDEKTAEYHRILGRKLRMKFIPKLHFISDNYQEKIDRVEKLLKEIDHGA